MKKGEKFEWEETQTQFPWNNNYYTNALAVAFLCYLFALTRLD